jgi:hypothetical protein
MDLIGLYFLDAIIVLSHDSIPCSSLRLKCTHKKTCHVHVKILFIFHGEIYGLLLLGAQCYTERLIGPCHISGVSRRLPTAAAMVRSQVKSYGICG